MATISSSETFVKQSAIFLSVHKTVNIQGYSKLREPIKTHENCYPLIWEILNIIMWTFMMPLQYFASRKIPAGAINLMISGDIMNLENWELK